MLFIVVAVFIACNLMVGVGVIYKLVTWDKPLTPSPIGGAVGIFLLVLNSSLNFIIYCIYGERFREVFVDLTAQLWRRLTRSRQRSDSDFSFGKCNAFFVLFMQQLNLHIMGEMLIVIFSN